MLNINAYLKQLLDFCSYMKNLKISCFLNCSSCTSPLVDLKWKKLNLLEVPLCGVREFILSPQDAETVLTWEEAGRALRSSVAWSSSPGPTRLWLSSCVWNPWVHFISGKRGVTLVLLSKLQNKVFLGPEIYQFELIKISGPATNWQPEFDPWAHMVGKRAYSKL